MVGVRSPEEGSLAQSPFAEVPTIETLTEEQLNYVLAVARDLDEQDFRRRKELLGDGCYFQLLGPAKEATIESLQEAYKRKRKFAVYSHRSANYWRKEFGKDPSSSEQEPVPVLTAFPMGRWGSGLSTVATSVDCGTIGNHLYFSFAGDLTEPIGAEQNRTLFDLGIPVLLVDLLTHSPLVVGQDLANVKTGRRLGEGVPTGVHDRPQRENYIVLKLAEPDAQGNLIVYYPELPSTS